MRFSELQVKISTDVSSFTQGLREVNADLAKTNAQVNRQSIGFTQFGNALANVGSRLTLGVTVPLVGLVGSAVKAAASLEVTETAFKTLMHSTDAAKEKLDELKRFAASTPFQFPELADATKRMLALGFSAKDVLPTLRIVGDATSALGMGSEGLNRIILALGQIKTKGAVQAEEMRQLAEAGIPAWDALAERLGVTVPEAMKLVEKRAVSAQVAIDAALGAMKANFGGGMEAQAKTLLGVWSNVMEKIGFAAADIGKSLLPVAKTIATDFILPTVEGAKNLAEGFSRLPAVFQNATVAVVGLVAAWGPATFVIGSVVTSITSMVSAARMVGPLLTTLSGTVARLAGVLAQNMVPGLTGVTASFATGAAAITAWGAAIAGIVAGVVAAGYAFWKLDDAMTANEKAHKSLEQTMGSLLIKLHQNGVDTSELDKQYRSGQIGVDQYVKALLKLVDAHVQAQKAIPGTAAAAAALAEAFKKLGIESGEELAKKLKEAQSALAEIQKAYRDGAASADDVARAQEVVQKAFDALHPSVRKASQEYQKWLEQFPKGKVLSDEAANAWAILQAKIGMVVDRKQELISSIAKLQVAQEVELATITALNQQYGIFAGIKNIPILEPSVKLPTPAIGDLKLPSLPKSAGSVIPTFGSIDEMRQYEAEFAKIEDAYQSGVLTAREYEAEIERLGKKFPEASKGATDMAGASTRASKQMSQSMRQVSTIITDLSRGLADALVNWKGLGDVGIKIAKDLATAIIRDLIEGAFKKLSGSITGCFGQLGALGGAIGKLFGGGASAASSAVGAAGSAAGSVGSAAGSIGSAVGSSVTGIVGAVAGVASAISGIVGNFQMAGMNKSLDVLVKHTLQLVMIGEAMFKLVDTRLDAVHARLFEMRTYGLGVWPQPGYEWAMSGAGGGGNTYAFEIGNVYGGPAGLDALADEIIRRLIQRGLKIS
ncbi:MAG: tape measure protein [Paludibaculum sp.]